ncbi:hypothetical protein MMC31_003465, partial [Peltigera leucophlebia]|nr:hypothetical protein [Peltigera leucophlebia]
MAEAIAVISFVSAVWSLADHGTKVVKRLNEFKTNVRDLPQSLIHISDQLPLLIDTVNRLHNHREGATASATASTWEKGLKAVKSVGYQKAVDEFAEVIDRYLDRAKELPTTPNGTAKEALLHDIKQRFKTKNRVVIHSWDWWRWSRIAIEYCYEYRKMNLEAHTSWVHGGSRTRFEEGYQEIARMIELPNLDDPKTDTLQLVCNWLSDEVNGSWFMVLDNADDAEIWMEKLAPLINSLPRGSHGSLLITTRDNQLGKGFTNFKQRPIDVLLFGQREAETLLRSKILDEDRISLKDANDITKALDYLPLAITQAAAYLNQTDMPIAKYLQLFRAGKAETSDLLKHGLHDPDRDHEIQNSVFQTWMISFDRISRQDPRAADLLSLMAMLDRQAIAEHYLRTEEEPGMDFIAAIQKLKAFSLIVEETEAKVFSMHRLIQLSVQKWLMLQKVIEGWQEKALSAVSKSCPSHGEYEYWTAWEAINPHVQVVKGYVVNTDSALLHRASILQRSGVTRTTRVRRLAWFEISLAEISPQDRDRSYPPRKGLDCLSIFYWDQGRYKVAEALCLRALDGLEKTLGPDQVTALETVNHLGTFSVCLENFERAEAFYLRALRGHQKTQGRDHASTLAIFHNLGILYAHQNKVEEAEAMFLRALERQENTLSPDHPSTLMTIYKLGLLYAEQNRLEEAEILYMRALSGAEKIATPDQISSLALRTIVHLSNLYRQQDRVDKAEAMYQRALAGQDRKIGQDHDYKVRTFNMLGDIYSEQGRLEEAKA